MSNLRSKANRDGRFMVVDERYWKSAKNKSSKSVNGGYFASNSSSSSSLSSLSSSASSERSSESFTKRCSSLIKQQRARFYIMRRCVVMLLCWHGDA